MSEFASLAMMRVLERGLYELGIAPPRNQSDGHFALPRGATVDLDAKRALLMHAISQGGVQCLVQLGRGVHHFADEPTHRAMTSASSPMELLQRWQRLEKYIHSLHRVELVNSEENQVGLVHRSKRIGTEPALTESLVVVGVLASLLEAMGAKGVTVHKKSIPVYPQLLERDVAARGLNDPNSAWVFEWTSVEKSTEGLADSAPSHFFDASDWPHVAKQVGNACVKDLISAPTVAVIAQKLATSPRSLQRRLSESGLSYSQLLGESRRRMAAWRLIATTTSLSEVGFFSGYSDQAHFTRDFRSRVGLTPAQYRREFATGL
jgi:AraC-like DNA-binding protein